MWESSGIGSLDFVKKFFAMAPGKESQRGKTVWEGAFYKQVQQRRTLTQDESPQVRLQALELVGVIL